ncbi:MAG: sigma-70 family RNA polymerase sigma factor [Sandaracinaceae bacterium]|jgi:RNA polymerase sigma-70 factor (ECF subfamily)|nr:sigma-70 family RNA polymerase sigma factor [Sandaracinaceae bacterium]
MLLAPTASTADFGARQASAAGELSFDEVYEAHVDGLWRCARAFGVPEQGVADLLQDVFVVVHRRLPELECSVGIRTWLTRILWRVLSQQRRTFYRKANHSELPDEIVDHAGSTPFDSTERAQASKLLSEILDSFDEDRRAVFVLAEFEQLTAPEVAEALGVNVNTVYSRLRLARRDYMKQLARLQARENSLAPAQQRRT